MEKGEENMQKVKAYTPGIIMIIVSLIFLSQAFAIEKATITDPAGGSFFPALISIVMLISGFTVIFQEQKKLKVEISEINHKAKKTEKFDYENTDMTFKEYKLVLTFFTIVVLYVLSLNFIPFLIATFIFLSLSMFYLRGVSWITNLIVSILSLIIIHFVFSELFKIIFP
jgi:hypothetical protein